MTFKVVFFMCKFLAWSDIYVSEEERTLSFKLFIASTLVSSLASLQVWQELEGSF